ncbi:mucin-2-like [Mytilus trossulus]|uniref:mucin-2-like n=1 Tax=Mytilus trossulus TaxID=6551 RepID=UPI003005E35F
MTDNSILFKGALPTSTNKTIAASSLHMANRTTHVHQKRKTQLSYNTRMTNLVEKYTEWDNWVNSNAPDGSGDDYEPIDEVLKHSHLCSYPIKIECLTTTGSKADDIGQIITCDLCSGLQCVNYDQSDSKGCADYKVRLACLKLPTECLTPVSTVPPVPVVTTTMKLPQTPTVNTNR